MNSTKFSSHSHRSRTSSGFTLAELVAVLGIMSMLLAMSVAAYTQMLSSKGIEGAQKTVSGAIFTARMKALRDHREVSCSIGISGAEANFYVAEASDSSLYAVQRERRPTETLQQLKSQASMNWFAQSNGQWRPSTSYAYWAVVVCGPRAGAIAQIWKSTESQIYYYGWNDAFSSDFDSTSAPAEGSIVSIIQGAKTKSDPPLLNQFKVSSDLQAGSWEQLPEYIQVDGSYFPITFGPDGSASFMYDHVVVHLRDTRTAFSEEGFPVWTYRLIIDRGSGKCDGSPVNPGDNDYLVRNDQ